MTSRRLLSRLIIILTAISVCLPCKVSAISSYEESEAPQAGSTIRIGYTDSDDFISQKDDGTYTGYGVELLNEISKYTGWEYEYVYGEWDEQLADLKTGEIDLVCKARKTEEREKEYLFSSYAVGSETGILYARIEDDRYYYNDFETFDGMKVGVIKGGTQKADLLKYAAARGFDVTTVDYGTQSECCEALKSGEVDAIALGSLTLKSDHRVIARFGAEPFYFMSGMGHSELMLQLDDALGQLYGTGTTFEEELYKKYYGNVTGSENVIFTREEAEYIENAGVIEVAVLPNRYPLSYSAEGDGSAAGITVDILKLIEERSGLTFQYTILKAGWELTDMLADNPNLLIAGLATENDNLRNGNFLVSRSFYDDEVVMAGKRGAEYTVSAPAGTYKLAVNESYHTLQTYLKENHPEFEIVTCKSNDEGMKLLKDGEVDFFAQNLNVLKSYLLDVRYDDFSVLPVIIMEESAGIVGSATDGNRTLLAIIDRCIGSITDQEITQITLDYTSSMEQEITFTDMLYRFRYPVITIALLVAAVIGLLVAFILMRRRNYRRLEINNVRLAAAVDDAQRANDAKSRFLARMSHEMRTPMNAIVGLTTLAQHTEESGEETVQGYLDKISASSKMLLGMINDVLDMSAIESDKLKLIREKFSLKRQLEAIVYVYEAQCRGKKIAIELDASHLVHERVIGDSLRLNQILLNLVSNAFKFTPSVGKITIYVDELSAGAAGLIMSDGSAVGAEDTISWQDAASEMSGQPTINYRISVTDTGEGISEEMMERLFTPFEQESPDTASQHGGSGLGLSIARDLAEYMGGNISCESKKGAGATFTLTIPLEACVSAGEINSVKACERSAASEVTGEYCSDEPKERDITDFDFTGYTVLLAEDTKMSADILKDMFALCRLSLDWAGNGAIAADKFAASERGEYLAILMDVQMPVMDGYKATEAIRAMEREDAKAIPIYAMTANAFEEDKEHAKRAGMNGHLTKPVDIIALCELLEGLTNSKRTL